MYKVHVIKVCQHCQELLAVKLSTRSRDGEEEVPSPTRRCTIMPSRSFIPTYYELEVEGLL